MKWGRFRVHWQRFSESRWGKWVLWAARHIVTVAIGAYLIFQLSEIGWRNLWASLPRTPWFYVLFTGIYLCLPFFQAIIFSRLWGRSIINVLPATLIKRVYDKDVFTYSGDIYLYFWSEKYLRLDTSYIVHSIKDNAIISGVSSTVVAVGLLLFFFVGGYITLPSLYYAKNGPYVVGGIIVVLLGGGGIITFRRTVFGLAGRLLGMMFLLHVTRLLVAKTLQVLEWNVVIPEISLEVWFTYLAVQIVVTKIPLLPSRDLIFLAAGIELAGAIQVSEAAIAGLLGVHSVLDKGTNLAVFGGLNIWSQVTDRPMPESADDAGAEVLFGPGSAKIDADSS